MASEFAKLFLGLPESLMVVIFNKVEDVKRLYHFYCVSEKMASLVTQTRSIYVEVPYEMALSSGNEAEWPENLLKFLRKFSCIESMTIRFAPGVPIDNVNHLLRWRGDINGLVFLKARGFDCGDEEEEEEVLLDKNRPTLIDCPTRIKYIIALLELFPSIKKISSLDCANEGVIELVDEGVKDLKNLNLMLAGHVHEEMELIANVHVKKWKIPMMELPLSETVIKRVQFYSETNDNGSKELMIKTAFPEDELSELVHNIMQKQPFFEVDNQLAKFHFFL